VKKKKRERECCIGVRVTVAWAPRDLLNYVFICRIQGFHSGGNEESRLLGCGDV
jgi:hypothetical protein